MGSPKTHWGLLNMLKGNTLMGPLRKTYYTYYSLRQGVLYSAHSTQIRVALYCYLVFTLYSPTEHLKAD